MDDIDRELLALEQRIAAYRLPHARAAVTAAAVMLDAMHDIERLLAADTIRSKRSSAALALARNAIRTVEGEQQ